MSQHSNLQIFIKFVDFLLNSFQIPHKRGKIPKISENWPWNNEELPRIWQCDDEDLMELAQNVLDMESPIWKQTKLPVLSPPSSKVHEYLTYNILSQMSQESTKKHLAMATVLERLIPIKVETKILHHLHQAWSLRSEAMGHEIQAGVRLANWKWNLVASDQDLQDISRILHETVAIGEAISTNQSKTVTAYLKKLAKNDPEYAASLFDEFKEWTTTAQTRLAFFLSLNPEYESHLPSNQLLQKLGFEWRLGKKVMAYPSSQANFPKDSPWVRVIDNALPEDIFQRFKQVMADDGKYFTEHSYNPYVSTGYFSYLFPVRETPRNFMEQVIMLVYDNVIKMYPHVKESVTDLEHWAHSRPHCFGHQMHYDSENEGKGTVRHPMVSCVLYLSDGGPTLVTTQTLQSDTLSTKAILSHSKPNRLCVFDAKYLHGVLPGRGHPNDSHFRRTTFMVGFWDGITQRPWDGKQGASRILPIIPDEGQGKYVRPRGFPIVEWPKDEGVNKRMSDEKFQEAKEWIDKGWHQDRLLSPTLVEDALWERVDGKIPKDLKLPPYQTCFQGF